MGIHLSALVTIKNQNGNVIKRRKLKLNSATYQFAQFLYEMFAASVSPSISYSPITIQNLTTYSVQPSPTTISPASGEVLYLEPVSPSFGPNGTLTQVLNPIIGLGTGTKAFSPSIAQLAAPLLIYSAYSSTEPTPNLTMSSPPSVYEDSGAVSYPNFYFSPAIYQNNTGSSITVSELGWYANIVLSSSGAVYTVLMTYDTISPAITIASGGTLTITYIIELE